MTFKNLRLSKNLTQAEAAAYLGISTRTYQKYETEPEKQRKMQYDYIVSRMNQYGYVDENNGILTVETIRDICSKVFSEYDVTYCYLFGSYAKNKAREDSDVDLLVNTTISGLKFFGLIEELREKLKKKVDLLDQRQLKDNFELTNEILKDGIKIYG